MTRQHRQHPKRLAWGATAQAHRRAGDGWGVAGECATDQ